MFADDPEMRKIVLDNILQNMQDMKGNEFAQLASANAIAALYGRPQPHDLDTWVETGRARRNWWDRFMKRIRNLL